VSRSLTAESKDEDRSLSPFPENYAQGHPALEENRNYAQKWTALSGLENREYGRRDVMLITWHLLSAKVGTNFAKDAEGGRRGRVDVLSRQRARVCVCV
jgi:hypothetical protein